MRDFKEIGKKAGKTLAFFLILLAILAGLSGQITELLKKDDALMQSRNKSIVRIGKEPKETIDVLVVGDSESYTFFSPMKLWNDQGIASYVCGQSGQKIQETYYMLKTAFESQTPKLVILETNVIFRAQTGAAGLREAVVEMGNYYFPIFRFHDIWKPLLMGTQYVEESYKGFVIRDGVYAYKGGTYMAKTQEREEISGLVQDYMRQMIDLCEEHGARLLLASAPSPVNYNYKKHNALKDYAKEQGLEYLDLNLKTRKLSIDWERDTLDAGDHLNLSGAHKVTKYLGEYLKAKYELPDRRDSTAYGEWEKEAKKYTLKARRKLKLMKRK